MFTNSLSSTKKICLSVLFTSIFCAAVFFSQTVPASAQTGASVSELQAQIATLMARITALQAGGASNSSTGSGGGSSSSMRSYRLADVQSVTKQFVDPNKAVADEEYTLYVITLKTGKKIEVKVPARTTSGAVEAAFQKTGFVGKASDLMSRAKEVSGETKPVCIKGKSGYDNSGRPGTAECLLSEPVKPASTTPPRTATYTRADVTSVTKQFVDPIKTAADDEYNLYVITLKTGQKIEVKVPVRITPSMAEEIFRKSGFVGKASELMEWATSPKPSEETFKVTVSNVTAKVSFTLSDGCGGYIISWGDGAKTELAGSPAARACTMAIVNVAKEHTYTKAGTYTVKVERFSGQTLRDTSTKEIKVGSADSSSYTLADVTSITKQVVAGSRMLADGGHTLYTVTLKNGRKIEVKISSGPITGSMVEAEFRKSGYTGSVADLLARATEVKKDTATTTPAAPRVTLVAGNDRLVNATVVVARTLRPVVVTGPTTLGTIAWGDGATESLIGLITGMEMTVKASHRYKTAGTYTVAVTDPNGKITKESITVKAGATATTTPIRTPMPSNGAVRGATTDVYQNIATVLVSLKQLLDTLEAR